jgi:hypothetical protein
VGACILRLGPYLQDSTLHLCVLASLCLSSHRHNSRLRKTRTPYIAALNTANKPGELVHTCSTCTVNVHEERHTPVHCPEEFL